MEVTIAFDINEAKKKSWQGEFPETTSCCRCEKTARLGFVAHEGIDNREEPKMDRKYICQVHKSEEEKLWLHDCCAVAVYFCEGCLEPTALYNQA